MSYQRLMQCSFIGLGLLTHGCQKDAAEESAQAPAANGSAEVAENRQAALPAESDDDCVWLVRVDQASAPDALLATAHRLHGKLAEQRIVAQPDGGLLLLAGQHDSKEQAEEALRGVRGALPDGHGVKVIECELSGGRCALWEALAISPSFYDLDPLDLPADTRELRVTKIDSASGITLKSVPYYDPNDNDGHTEGFVARVDIDGPKGTLTLDKRCIMGTGSLSPDGTKAAVECVRDYVADIPRFHTAVYRVSDGQKLTQLEPCRGTSWDGSGTLVCKGDFVNDKGEEVAKPDVLGRHTIP